MSVVVVVVVVVAAVVTAAMAVVLATIRHMTCVGNLRHTIMLLLARVVHLFRQSRLPQITPHQCSLLVKDHVERVQSQTKVSSYDFGIFST
jgi:hypothetical protein